MLEIFYCFHNIVFYNIKYMYLICENDTWKSEKYISTSNKFSGFQIFRFYLLLPFPLRPDSFLESLLSLLESLRLSFFLPFFSSNL